MNYEEYKEAASYMLQCAKEELEQAKTEEEKKVCLENYEYALKQFQQYEDTEENVDSRKPPEGFGMPEDDPFGVFENTKEAEIAEIVDFLKWLKR